MERETVVTVTSRRGEKLLGILHTPEEPTPGGRRVGINLLNPGLKCRVAPNRLYVKLARVLTERGFHVLRVDPAGIGDSEGELPEAAVADLWGEIQRGRFVPDALAMNDHFARACALDDMILMGSCGGAITALLAGVRDERVRALTLIDLPVTLSSTKTMSEDYLAIIEADASYRRRLSAYYLKGLFRPSSWLRFLTLKSDYRAIAKVIALKLRGVAPRPGADAPQDAAPDVPNLNPLVLPAFRDFVQRGGNVLFLCAERDTDTQLFEKGFREPNLQPGNPFEGACRVEKIREANHIYALEESQEALIGAIVSWLGAPGVSRGHD